MLGNHLINLNVALKLFLWELEKSEFAAVIFETLHREMVGTLALKYMDSKNAVQSMYFVYACEKCKELFSNWKDFTKCFWFIAVYTTDPYHFFLHYFIQKLVRTMSWHVIEYWKGINQPK